MKIQKFKIVSTQSNIDWVGKKVTAAHNGTIAVKEGEIVLTDGKLTGGRFVIDTEKYPKATLVIFSVSGNHVEGNLAIKGITHPVGFDVTVTVNGDQLTA